MCSRGSFILLLFILSALITFSQGLPDRNWHFRVPMSVTAGVNIMNVDHQFGERFIQSPGIFLGLDGGVSLTRKELWGTAIMAGGQLDNYAFSGGNANYDVATALLRTEGRAFYYVPLSEKLQTHLTLSMGAGYTFFSSDSLSNTESALTVNTQTFRKNAAYLCPEVGITKQLGRNRMNISVRYQFHLDRSSPNIRMDLSTPTAQAIATSFGDNLSLNVGFHLEFKKKEKPKFPPPDVDYYARKNDEIETYTTKRTAVTLVLWDNATVDGDTISVLVNGICVLSEYALQKEKLKLKIDLKKGANHIMIVAHNEGTIPPNTATCLVKTGKRNEELLLRTFLDENDIIRVFRE